MLRKTFLIAFIVPTIIFARQQDEVPLLRWMGPPGSKPGTFKEWLAENPYTPQTSVALTNKLFGSQKGPSIAIITKSTIASYLSTSINQLMTNLQAEGYTVSSYSFSGGTPESLKTFIKNLYNTENIEGVLLVGSLPVAWFQIGDDYDTYGYAEWPIDLFYMDLDGNWLDTLKQGTGDTLVPGTDTVYDTHSGNIAPEIYVGRLTPTGIGTDTASIRNYLLKNNSYRHHTSIELPHKALVYVDDDWYYWAPTYANNVALLYNDTAFFRDSNVTRATDYRSRLDTARAWVSVFVHSSPSGHSFYYNDHNSVEYYYSSEYRTQDPPANFYNHFACSFARYTTNNYGGGSSIFNQTYGLGAVGSAKTGSMLDFEYFYQPLSEGKTMGTAFKDWFTHITNGGVDPYEISWHYGMTLLGDPFLKPTGNISVEEKSNIKTQAFQLSVSPNPFTSSTTIQFNPNSVGNRASLSAEGMTCSISIFDVSGKLIEKTDNPIIGKNLKPGVYFVRIGNSNPIKIIKMGSVK